MNGLLGNPVYLCGISYDIGELHDIGDLRANGESEEAIELLLDRGVRSFSKLDGSLEEFMLRKSLDTLAEINLKPSQVDAVIVVTESFAELIDGPPTRGDTRFRTMRNRLFTSFSGIGINKKVFICSTFGGSGNFLNAMFITAPLIRTGQLNNVLMICADQNPLGVSRFMEDSLAVAADGVAACLLSSSPPSRVTALKVDYAGITPFIVSEEWQHLGDAVLEMYRATKAAAADCYETMNLQPGDFDWLVMNNYNEMTSDIFMKLLGFDRARTFLHNIPRTGHIPACDILVNLKDLNTLQSGLKVGNRVFVYINSPYASGALSLFAV